MNRPFVLGVAFFLTASFAFGCLGFIDFNPVMKRLARIVVFTLVLIAAVAAVVLASIWGGN